jgi:hypothetical protein
MSELLERFQSARNSVAVPAVPLGRIRDAALSRKPRAGRGKIVFAGVVAGLMLAAAATAATATWMQTHVVADGTHPLVIEGNGDGKVIYKKNPTDADFREAARNADFPVTLPAGLPPGTVARQLFRSGKSAILISYDLPGAWRADNHMMWIVLANPKSMQNYSQSRAGSPALTSNYAELAGEAGKGNTFWKVGGETVVFPKSTATAEEYARIKAAMSSEVTR